LQNQKLRGKAESIQAGLQAARTAAVQLNTNVEFLLTTAEPSDATVVGAAANAAGPHWMVRGLVLDTATEVSTITLLQSEHALTGSGSNTVSEVSIKVAATTGSVTFTPFGNTTLGAAETIQVTNPAGGDCKAAGGAMRCLNILVSPGGQIRMCDPAVSAAGDTRKC
jgi:type IV fimbrial biogenesis protein FimT